MSTVQVLVLSCQNADVDSEHAEKDRARKVYYSCRNSFAIFGTSPENIVLHSFATNHLREAPSLGQSKRTIYLFLRRRRIRQHNNASELEGLRVF
ncbi:hypothetical protein KCU85_g384, partial [Aureobasidium melanogenum]